MRKISSWFVSLVLMMTAIISFNGSSNHNNVVNNNSNIFNQAENNFSQSSNQILEQKNPFISHFTNSGISTNANIFCLATNNNSDIIYAGTSDQGLYTSIDGIVFNRVSSFINAFVTAITIDNNGIIWIGTQNQGLYQSIDNCQTFNQIKQTSSIEQIDSIFLTTNGTMYLNSKLQGWYQSTDKVNFTKVNVPNNKNYPVSIIEFMGKIYVGTDQGLYQSNKDGQTFTKVNDILGNIEITALLVKDLSLFVGTNHQGLYVSTNDFNFAKVNVISNNISIISLTYSHSNNYTQGSLFVGTNKGLYKISSETGFENVLSKLNNFIINNMIVSNQGVIYFSCSNKGLWAINLMQVLVKINVPDYYGNKYNGFVYNKETKINLYRSYLASASLDGNDITTDTTYKNLSVKKHTLKLILNPKYCQYLNLFTDNSKEITYHFWIKTTIDSNQINYKLRTDDTDLITGLVSNRGNTINSPVIRTKVKTNSGQHASTVAINITSNMIDFKNSYYVAGRIDDKTNNFSQISFCKKILSNNFSITEDGIYHLHLTDVAGNSYDSYLELGISNWKLDASFNGSNYLQNFADKLNVKLPLNDSNFDQVSIWLNKYQWNIDQAIDNSIEINSKGFNITSSDLVNYYKLFLNQVIYTSPATKEAINQKNLNQAIENSVNKDLSDGLNKLPKNLNVDTSKVVNKQTLDSYTSWITGYQNYIMTNWSRWITNIFEVATYGYGNDQQFAQIKLHARDILNNYLLKVTWTPNDTSDYYRQFIDFKGWQSNVINWVKDEFPIFNKFYQSALTKSENKVNMHGYHLAQLLNGNPVPQTKEEIVNYADGKSFSKWLQDVANQKYHHWQLTMGLSIATSLLTLVLIIIGVSFYWENKKLDRSGILRKIKILKKAEMTW